MRLQGLIIDVRYAYLRCLTVCLLLTCSAAFAQPRSYEYGPLGGDENNSTPFWSQWKSQPKHGNQPQKQSFMDKTKSFFGFDEEPQQAHQHKKAASATNAQTQPKRTVAQQPIPDSKKVADPGIAETNTSQRLKSLRSNVFAQETSSSGGISSSPLRIDEAPTPVSAAATASTRSISYPNPVQGHAATKDAPTLAKSVQSVTITPRPTLASTIGDNGLNNSEIPVSAPKSATASSISASDQPIELESTEENNFPTPSILTRPSNKLGVIDVVEPIRAAPKNVETPVEDKVAPNILLSRQSPLIEVETIGPQKIVVGQEAAYEIKMRNTGNAPAEQVVLSIDLPAWAEIRGVEASSGATSVASSDSNTNVFQWKIDQISQNGDEMLVLHILPRQRKPFDLKMQYDFKRQTSKTMIEVQEPQIELALEGPSEMLWGTEETYRLRVRNVGNGDASNVELTLILPNTDVTSAPRTTIESLKAGQEQSIVVKAWARQDDFLDINVLAASPMGLKAEVSRRVAVLRSRLNISVEAADFQFVGNQVEYLLKVRNDGSAHANKVELTAAIPMGAKYIHSDRDGRASAGQGSVVWNVDTIPIGSEFVCSLVCELRRDGDCKLDFRADDSTGMNAVASAITRVDSVANLSMKLDGPQGPIEVGRECVYTISVVNDGTKSASDIDVVAAFVSEVDPIRIENGAGTIVDGMILFDRIPLLNPGQVRTLKVRAVAQQAGSHKMRVEMASESVGAHLVHEGTTIFYQKLKGSGVVAESYTAKSEIGRQSPDLIAVRKMYLENQAEANLSENAPLFPGEDMPSPLPPLPAAVPGNNPMR